MIVLPGPLLRKRIYAMGKEERTVFPCVAVLYSLRTVTLIASRRNETPKQVACL